MASQISILLVCLAICCIRPSVSKYESQFHHNFEIGGGKYLNWHPIVTKQKELRIFYFNSKSDGSWILATDDFAHYVNQRSNILDDVKKAPMYIFVVDKAKPGLEKFPNGTIISFNEKFDIQVSIDNGKSWKYDCQNCTKIISNGTDYFDEDYNPIWSSNLNMWIAPYHRNDYTLIAGAKDIHEWYLGNRLVKNSDIAINGMFQMAELDNPTNIKTFYTYWDINGRWLFGYEISVTLDGSGIPVGKILNNPRYYFDESRDLKYLYPADDGMETKSAKTFIPFLYNIYIDDGTNGIVWNYILGIPRSVTFKKVNDRIEFYQAPLLDLTNTKIWTQFSLPSFKIGTDPEVFSCATSTAFSLSAEINTKSVNEFSFYVRANKQYTNFTRIGFSNDNGCFIDRNSSGYFSGMNMKNVWIKGYEKNFTTDWGKYPDELDFLGFIDTFTVEVFCFKGESVISAFIFPDITWKKIKLVGKNGDVLKNFNFRKFKK